MTLKTSDFNYDLDSDLIAQRPLPRRDQSRLLRLQRSEGDKSHHSFAELPSLLQPGDLLVVNNTQVIPAKFACLRQTGGKIEGLFLREIRPGRWEVMLKNARRCRPGEQLTFSGDDGISMTLGEDLGLGRWQVRVAPASPAVEILQQVGRTPLPPYIQRSDGDEPGDSEHYQTIYASSPGAVAAPTAGLHFSESIFSALAEKGIETAAVTLHVGMGTFSPVKADSLTEHQMHSEWYDLPGETAAKLNAARNAGRRIVAVGTTSVRVLETVARQMDTFEPASGWTKLFIYPPAEFHAIDAMITNFHLPKSTLLMLVAGFCQPGSTGGIKMILDTYAEAVRQRYRFFSYGDAMLIE